MALGETTPAADLPSDRGWQRLGPGGGGGVFHPTVSPHDPSVLVVGCDMTGNYVSADGGASWSNFNLGRAARCFRFSPTERRVLYAGSHALWRSEDMGASWELVFPSPGSPTHEDLAGDEADPRFAPGDGWPGGEVRRIALDPEDPGRLWVAIASARGQGTADPITGLLIFTSADRGASWEPVAQINAAECLALEADPSTPASSRGLVCVTDRGLTSGPGAGAGGAGWDEPELPEGAGSAGASSVGFTEAGEMLAWLVTPRWADSARGSRLWVARGAGGAPEEVASGADFFELGQGAGSPPRMRAVACPLGAPGTVYLSVSRTVRGTLGEVNHFGIYLTSDGGASWAEALRACAGARQHEPANYSADWLTDAYGSSWGGQAFFLGCAANDGSVCVATDYGRCYSTTDGGASWRQLMCDFAPDGSYTTRGLDVTTCYGVHFDPFNPETMLVSYTDIGFMKSATGGRTWRSRLGGVPREWVNTCYWAAFDPDVEGKLWTVWANGHDLPRMKMLRDDVRRFAGGVATSTDCAESFTVTSDGLPSAACTQIVMDTGSPPGRRRLYVTAFGHGVYRSTDDGRTWEPSSDGLPEENRNCWRIARGPSGRLYLALHRAVSEGSETPGGIYVSDDRAETWRRLDVSDLVPAPSDVAVNGSDSAEIMVAGWPCRIGDREYTGGLWRSRDRGENFERTSLPARYVYSATFLDEGRTIYATTFRRGVFRSTDGGENWRRLAGMDFKWPHRVFADPFDPEYIYVTTFGGSVWRGRAVGSSPDEVPWELGG